MIGVEAGKLGFVSAYEIVSELNIPTSRYDVYQIVGCFLKSHDLDLTNALVALMNNYESKEFVAQRTEYYKAVELLKQLLVVERGSMV